MHNRQLTERSAVGSFQRELSDQLSEKTERSAVGPHLGNLTKHMVEPMRIEGKRLSVFLDAYLNERRKRDLFDDPEYFDACSQLSRMVGERDVTVLLAKLYADQMVATKESPTSD